MGIRQPTKSSDRENTRVSGAGRSTIAGCCARRWPWRRQRRRWERGRACPASTRRREVSSGGKTASFTTPSAPSTRTPSSWRRSPSCGRSCPSSPTSGAASGTPPASTPPATSSPPTATPTTGPSARPASISTSPPWPSGGCLIVDSTRKGKRFPDSMSKTIPIWACVLNRAINNRLRRRKVVESEQAGGVQTCCSFDETASGHVVSVDWDTSLHLPLWVSKTEKAAIEDRLEQWTQQLEDCGADIDALVLSLKKPLRPLWISQMTVIWLNEVPASSSWDFTPIILVSASSPNGVVQQRSTCEFSWHYIPGAGDDEESWARGLTPNLFWKHALDLIRSEPDLCNKKVAELVERDRVYRAQRGEDAPQFSIKLRKPIANNGGLLSEESNIDYQILNSAIRTDSASMRSSGLQFSVFWIGVTNLAVGTSSDAEHMSKFVDCILDCDSGSGSFHSLDAIAYLHLPIVTPKVDRFSLLKNLPSALNFAKSNLSMGKRLLVSCHNGEDISICVCLAILTCLFDEWGTFDGGKSFSALCVTKWEVKRRLVFICKYVTTARPCRGNLKQVFGFLSRERESLDCAGSAII